MQPTMCLFGILSWVRGKGDSVPAIFARLRNISMKKDKQESTTQCRSFSPIVIQTLMVTPKPQISPHQLYGQVYQHNFVSIKLRRRHTSPFGCNYSTFSHKFHPRFTHVHAICSSSIHPQICLGLHHNFFNSQLYPPAVLHQFLEYKLL